MTKEEAFTLWASKHDMSAGLPWEPSHDLLKTVFSAGWDAKTEADKQTEMFPASEETTVTPADIYEAYPRHEGRGAAIKAIEKAIASKKVHPATLYQAVLEYAAAVKAWPQTARFTVDGRSLIPLATTWVNQERWTDDRATWQRGGMVANPSQFSRTYK